MEIVPTDSSAALNAARSAPLSETEVELLMSIASLDSDQQQQVLDLIEHLAGQPTD